MGLAAIVILVISSSLARARRTAQRCADSRVSLELAGLQQHLAELGREHI